MKFEIEHAPVFSILRVTLEQNESFRAEAGAMVSMSSNIELEAKGSGKGLLGSLKAAVGGESLFASLYTAKDSMGEVVLAPAAPGDILQIELKNETLYAAGGAYLAGDKNLELSSKGSFKSVISAADLFLSKITGTGTVFISSYGSILMKELGPEDVYVIDSGHLVAFTEQVQYKVSKASKGIFASLASGEGLVSKFKGPGKVWYQTRNIQPLAGLISRYIVK